MNHWKISFTQNNNHLSDPLVSLYFIHSKFKRVKSLFSLNQRFSVMWKTISSSPKQAIRKGVDKISRDQQANSGWEHEW